MYRSIYKHVAAGAPSSLLLHVFHWKQTTFLSIVRRDFTVTTENNSDRLKTTTINNEMYYLANSGFFPTVSLIGSHYEQRGVYPSISISIHLHSYYK